MKVALAAFTLTTALSATGALAETPSWCGPNEASLALLDGFGGNSWRLVTTASGQEEAAKCPSITEYVYADGQGNTQKAISDINSMAARGINAMVAGHISVKKKAMACIKAFSEGDLAAPLEQFPGKKAFINDNINQLKRGAVLRIPATEEVQQLGAAEAAQLVRAQAEAWLDEGTDWDAFLRSYRERGRARAQLLARVLDPEGATVAEFSGRFAALRPA